MIKYPIAIYKTIRTILKHKIAMCLVGPDFGVTWKRILLHDLSKFHPKEFWQYVKKFELKTSNEEEWLVAWQHHWENNDHHPQYWEKRALTHSFCEGEVPHWNGFGRKHKNPDYKEYWMPDYAIREMIADWVSASYAYSGIDPVAGSWGWGHYNLVKELKKLEVTHQPETTTRCFAVGLLFEHNLITNEQLLELQNDADFPTRK